MKPDALLLLAGLEHVASQRGSMATAMRIAIFFLDIWHVDMSELNIGGALYFIVSILL